MKLGFIGCGKMATALVEGILKSGVIQADNIAVSDYHHESARKLAETHGLKQCASNSELVEFSDSVILCVKPGDADGVLKEVDLKGKLLISILAGVTLESLSKMAGEGARLVRVMPNTPALVHRGASAYALGAGANEKDDELVKSILSAVGTAFRVEEKLLDAVTGLSGSGPAYVYVVIEALADAGVLVGLPRELALSLAAQTVVGAAEMVIATGKHPAQLKDMVTSPGGTTIAGLEFLEKSGIRSSFLGAVRAATERSRELGRQ